MSPVQPPPCPLNAPPSSSQPPPSGSRHLLRCPPDLEALLGVTNISVKQAVNVTEFYNSRNQYDVITNRGDRIYHVTETTDTLTSTLMPYNLMVIDYTGRPVLYLASQPDRCGGPGAISVAYGSQAIGQVSQTGGTCGGTPTYTVTNGMNEMIFQIVPSSPSHCMGSGSSGTAKFNVVSADGKVVVGRISKLWSGLLQERYTNAVIFDLSFSANMDVMSKAVLMGTTIMLNFQFFQKKD